MSINSIQIPKDMYVSRNLGELGHFPTPIFEPEKVNIYKLGDLNILVEELDNEGFESKKKIPYVAAPTHQLDIFWYRANNFIRDNYTTKLGSRNITFGGLAKLDKPLITIFNRYYYAKSNFDISKQFGVVKFEDGKNPEFYKDFGLNNDEVTALKHAKEIAEKENAYYNP